MPMSQGHVWPGTGAAPGVLWGWPGFVSTLSWLFEPPALTALTGQGPSLGTGALCWWQQCKLQSDSALLAEAENTSFVEEEETESWPHHGCPCGDVTV